MQTLGFMDSQISVSAFTESAFVLLVMVACGRVLLQRSSGPSSRWRQELSAVESSLRDIVSEATIASGTLDKQLLRRQEDLELLLRRIEKAQTSFEDARLRSSRESLSSADNHTALRTRTSQRQADEPLPYYDTASEPESTEVDDLPNHTWSARSLPKGFANTSNSAQEANNRLSLNNPSNSQAHSQSLRTQIEVSAAKETNREDRELLRTIDAAARRVAERLLRSGIEIHVVARKLELSVAQVRAIDALMSQGSPHDSAPSAASTQLRSPSQNRRANHSILLNDELPWTIDRETALL